MTPSTKAKILNALLILTSLMGYLEWGKDNQVFLFQAEGQILLRLLNEPVAVAHSFTVLPMLGQLIFSDYVVSKKSRKNINLYRYGGNWNFTGLYVCNRPDEPEFENSGFNTAVLVHRIPYPPAF